MRHLSEQQLILGQECAPSVINNFYKKNYSIPSTHRQKNPFFVSPKVPYRLVWNLAQAPYTAKQMHFPLRFFNYCVIFN